jgi:hypothetical protein
VVSINQGVLQLVPDHREKTIRHVFVECWRNDDWRDRGVAYPGNRAFRLAHPLRLTIKPPRSQRPATALDPDHPAERLVSMLRDAQPACVLTNAPIAERLRLPEGVTQLLLDHPDAAAALAQSPETNPLDTERTGPLSPHNLAYVIYTSGSTGASKGGVVTHDAVVNYTAWALEAYRLTAGSGCAYQHSPGV